MIKTIDGLEVGSNASHVPPSYSYGPSHRADSPRQCRHLGSSMRGCWGTACGMRGISSGMRNLRVGACRGVQSNAIVLRSRFDVFVSVGGLGSVRIERRETRKSKHPGS